VGFDRQHHVRVQVEGQRLVGQTVEADHHPVIDRAA
jgi:hypothetical protein